MYKSKRYIYAIHHFFYFPFHIMIIIIIKYHFISSVHYLPVMDIRMTL